LEYIYSEIQAHEGTIVEVALDQQANVRLLDPTNYQLFKSGQQHQYYGGRALRSPIRLPVPSRGRWYIVIDLGGHGGTIRHNIRLIS
jgi:Domain of unknown function (DUF1883)